MTLERLKDDRWTPAAAAHLLNRAGFGGPPAEIDRLHQLGLEGAVAELLREPGEGVARPPDWVAEGMAPLRRLAKKGAKDGAAEASMNGNVMEGGAMAAEEGAAMMMAATASEEERRRQFKENQRQERFRIAQLQDWWLQLMRKAGTGAAEKLALFWHGHFATSFQKVNSASFMWAQNDTFRKRGAGPFPDLAKAVSRDPAMIIWLDLRQSRAKAPNENFARELLELFMLGEGRYSEEDIREAARAFTGYRINPATGFFRFEGSGADMRQKRFMGREGRLVGDDIIDIAAGRPECAEFLCAKLWRFYAADQPSAELVSALAAEYRRADLHTGRLLRFLFTRDAFYADGVAGRQIKSPVQWIVQTARVFELPAVPTLPALKAMRELGQTLFFPPNVKGWDGGKRWIATSTLLARYNMAPAISGLPGGGEGRDAIARRIRRFAEENGFEPSAPRADLATLFPAELRRDPNRLVEETATRLFGPGTGPREEIAALAEFARTHNMGDDVQMARLLELAMSTPRFQLC